MSLHKPYARSARREWRWLKANKWDMAMVTYVPMLAILLIWWIYMPIIPYKLPVGVWDDDGSVISRQITRYIDANPLFEVVAQYPDEKSAQAGLKSSNVYAVMYIPNHLQNDLKTGQPSNVVLNVNAQFGTHSKLIQNSMLTVIGTVSAGVQMQMRMGAGQSPEQAVANFSPITTNLQPLFNIANDYQLYLATAIMPALIHILAMTAGAVAAGRELRDKSMARWLGVGRLSFWAYFKALFGKLTPIIVTFLSISTFMLVLIQTAHPVAMSSFLITLLALYELVLLSIILGVMFAFMTFSMGLAVDGTGLLTSPAFAFSGTGFPLLAMSTGAYMWAMALPYTHYAVLQVRQLQMQAPARYALPAVEGYFIAIVIALGITLCAMRFAHSKPKWWGMG